MNCQAFALIVTQLARDQAAPAHEQGLAHAEACVQCATLLAEERALQLGVRAVNAEIANAEAPARVEAALLSAFRAQAEKREALVSKPLGLLLQWRLGAAWAAALLVILLFGVAWIKLQSGEQKQEGLPSPPINLAPPKDAIAANIGLSITEQQPARPIVQRLKPRRIARRAPIPASEAMSPFYALVEEGELAPLESGRVVRVEMSASTLIPFGFLITAETLTQPVQADLLLGQDGLARAIRFLPAGQTTKTQ